MLLWFISLRSLLPIFEDSTERKKELPDPSNRVWVELQIRTHEIELLGNCFARSIVGRRGLCGEKAVLSEQPCGPAVWEEF
jgi:hypothetical protein